MRNITLLTALLFTATLFSQGAWTKSKNEVYTQLSYYSIGGYSGIYGDPGYQSERKLTDNTLQLYAEYGVSDKTTFVFSLPIKMIKAEGLVDSATSPLTAEGSETALGNITIGIKHSLLQSAWVVSGQLNIGLKTGSFFEESGLRSGYDTYTLSPKINVGRSFGRFYAQGSTGVDVRFNDYSSSYVLDAELGAKPFNRFWTIGFFNLSSSFENGEVILPANNLVTGFYVNDQEYAAYGLKFIFEATDKIGVLANYTTAISGNNVPRRAVFGFGLYGKF
ncbi:hypothetical protein JQC67_09130 [Aurantibacter crassamenti]|uniref:hypothetical protein n=1 Tax=Aurantibacter crassamenti TaxID=1837375 RepID=UPI00193A23AD|nr:hypothetical protein [Aurantibacter crassamenti]MBM1106296.1 hypothetical protein [Aurantibacter crassamenti]